MDPRGEMVNDLRGGEHPCEEKGEGCKVKLKLTGEIQLQGILTQDGPHIAENTENIRKIQHNLAATVDGLTFPTLKGNGKPRPRTRVAHGPGSDHPRHGWNGCAHRRA